MLEKLNRLVRIAEGVEYDFDTEQKMSAKTARARKNLAKTGPLQFLLKKKVIEGDTLYHGVGQDLIGYEAMSKQAGTMAKYDPETAPDRSVMVSDRYDTVVSIYVLNTLPPSLRKRAIEDIQMVLRPSGKGYIIVRADEKEIKKGDPVYDGYRMKSGTFQKSYTTQDLFAELRPYFSKVDLLKKDSKFLAVEVSKFG